MKSRHRKNLIVGIFVTIGLTIFIVTIYLVGKKENIFGSPVKVSAIFEDVQGLREGDKVRLSGIDIGNVSSLSFMQDNHVFVQMNLDAELVKFVMKDSRVTIGSEGLMGSKVVMIIPGSMTSQPVNEFDTLVTVEQVSIDDILIEVNKSSENIAIVSSELISITQKINRGDGIFGKIFTDTTLTRNLDDATRNISYITENLYDISEKVNQGQGIVGKLFADSMLTSELGSAGQNMDEIANNIREITEKINQGEGIFGRMFTDTALTNNLFLTSKNLQETSNSLSTLAAKLSNDSSALNMFINDPSFADSLSVLMERLNTGIIETTEAADAVQRSGLIRLFSKKKKPGTNEEQPAKPQLPQED
jgi:phospholipid/cholesterol/gamma-HCH transport system substrate-binding protein